MRVSQTSTTEAARAHARAQAGVTAETMPFVPARNYPHVPEGIDAGTLTWAQTVASGCYASKVLSRGSTLRLTDLRGDACAHLLLYNAEQPWERLNTADTVKVPWQAYIGVGHPLLSDQGRVLGTIVGDTSGKHDVLCGASSQLRNAERYGDGAAYGPTPAGRELLLLAGAKHGLGPRDIPASISFFQGVRVGGAGELIFVGSAGAERSVEVRCELPVVALLANAPHPLDPRERYAGTPLEVLAWPGSATTREDPLWSSSPELERAFLNTADYTNARGLD